MELVSFLNTLLIDCVKSKLLLSIATTYKTLFKYIGGAATPAESIPEEEELTLVSYKKHKHAYIMCNSNKKKCTFTISINILCTSF
jgi:hypothetical protein